MGNLPCQTQYALSTNSYEILRNKSRFANVGITRKKHVAKGWRLNIVNNKLGGQHIYTNQICGSELHVTFSD